jgi:hypothetical protein
MVGGSLRVLQLLLPLKLVGRHDIAELLLKVALNTKIQIQIPNKMITFNSADYLPWYL